MGSTGFGLVTGRPTMAARQWHDVAAVFDGTGLRVYLDGILDATAATSVAPRPVPPASSSVAAATMPPDG